MARPKKLLTDEQIAQVEKLAAVLDQEQMADFFGFSDDTLRARMKDDARVLRAYKRGRAKAAQAVGRGLLQDALNGDQTARIFYLKTQCGWREKQSVEVTGKNGDAVEINVGDVRAKVIDRLTRMAAIAASN